MNAEFWVSHRSVVHLAASNCRGGNRYPWNPDSAYDFDRPCRNCLPAGIPPTTPAPAARACPDDPADAPGEVSE